MAIERFPFPNLVPDWGLSDEIRADVEEIALGDGYVLRRPKGINHLKTTWSPGYGFLTLEEQTEVRNWLKPRLKLVPFIWTHPTTGEDFQVVCQSLKTSATDVGIFPLQFTIEQDFTPVP